MVGRWPWKNSESLNVSSILYIFFAILYIILITLFHTFDSCSCKEWSSMSRMVQRCGFKTQCGFTPLNPNSTLVKEVNHFWWFCVRNMIVIVVVPLNNFFFYFFNYVFEFGIFCWALKPPLWAVKFCRRVVKLDLRYWITPYVLFMYCICKQVPITIMYDTVTVHNIIYIIRANVML